MGFHLGRILSDGKWWSKWWSKWGYKCRKWTYSTFGDFLVLHHTHITSVNIYEHPKYVKMHNYKNIHPTRKNKPEGGGGPKICGRRRKSGGRGPIFLDSGRGWTRPLRTLWYLEIKHFHPKHPPPQEYYYEEMSQFK